MHGVDIFQKSGRRGRDRMIVGFTSTYVISAYHPHQNDKNKESPIFGI